MKTTTLALLSAMTLGVATSASAVIVYQDTFDNDGATNTGVGGELLAGARNGATLYTDGGDLTASTNFGSHQSFAWTQNQFDLSAGFELDVDFSTVAAGNPSFAFAFGILDEVNSTAGLGGLTEELNMSNNQFAGRNAVMLSTTTRNSGAVGIDLDSGGSLTEIASAIDAALTLGTAQSFNLTVNADGSGSATIDATTANFAVGTFSDLFTNSTDGKFHFGVFAQGNNDPGGSLQSVTITAVPEPGSLALLGLGGLLIARRRRA